MTPPPSGTIIGDIDTRSADFSPDEIVELHGMLVTSPVRTFVDLANDGSVDQDQLAPIATRVIKNHDISVEQLAEGLTRHSSSQTAQQTILSIQSLLEDL